MRINVYGIRGFPNIQGGVERHCEELYPRIVSKEIRFKIFRRKTYTGKSPKQGYKYILFKDIWTIKNKYLETILHSIACCIETLRDRPDIVHVHNIGPAITIPLLRLFGLKVIVTYHSANYEHSKWNWFAKYFLRFSEKLVFLFANKIIFVSRNQIEKTSRNNPKFVLIPNGISSFDKLKHKISLQKYNLKKDSYIISVGRIVPEKRFSDLIQAFLEIDSSMKLVIAGNFDNDKKYFDKLNSFKNKLGERLIFTGYLKSNNLKLLYENAYCFVLPSENEGMPIVLLEAMSFGLCPLVSDIRENTDVIGNKGFSFRCKDVDDLRKKLEYMLANPGLIKKKGKECKAMVEKNYRWDAVAERTLEIYREITN